MTTILEIASEATSIALTDYFEGQKALADGGGNFKYSYQTLLNNLKTMTSDLTFSGQYHPVIDPGSNVDAVLLQFDAGGTPTAQVSWDASKDSFSFDKGADFYGTVSVLDGATTLVLGADSGATTLTNATSKFVLVTMPHYLTAEQNVLLIRATSTSTATNVQFGGSSASFNSPTTILFYTAADTITTTGTEIVRYTIDGVRVSNGTLYIKEQASANADISNFGQIWVENLTPNILKFTNDVGTDGRVIVQTSAPTYTPSNVTSDRSFDADTVLVAELADVVGTLIADLQSVGLLA